MWSHSILSQYVRTSFQSSKREENIEIDLKCGERLNIVRGGNSVRFLNEHKYLSESRDEEIPRI